MREWLRRTVRFEPASRPSFGRVATESAKRQRRRDAVGERRRRSISRIELLRSSRNITAEERSERRMTGVALAITVAGFTLVLFVVYLYMFTGLQQSRNQYRLLNEFTVPSSAATLFTTSIPKEGQPSAVLEIPAIGLRQIAVEGSSATDLTTGPGLMLGTARPGTKGNAVIAGRRSTSGGPFGRIDTLHRGDMIRVTTGLGHFQYRVEHVGEALPGQRDPISPTSQAQLTLVTSNSGIWSTGRTYVVANLVSPAATAPIPKRPPSPSQQGLSGDPSAELATFLWGCLFFLGVGTMIIAYRRLPRQPWVVYFLATPVVAALALEWFQNLYRLLPATM
jgi:sortase A